MANKLGKITKTKNGFPIIKFKDRYKNPCSLELSSLADGPIPGTSAVWLGVVGQEQMHLDHGQVAALVSNLRHWLDHGVFAGMPEHPALKRMPAIDLIKKLKQ